MTLHAACHMHCATEHNKPLTYVAACGVPREASCRRAWISAKQIFWRANMRHRRICGSRQTDMPLGTFCPPNEMCTKLIKSNDKSMSLNIWRLFCFFALLLSSLFSVFLLLFSRSQTFKGGLRLRICRVLCCKCKSNYMLLRILWNYKILYETHT